MGKLVEIIWMDATSGQLQFDEVKKADKPKVILNPNDFMIMQKTYGRLLYEDSDFLIVLNNENCNSCDYTAIPSGWVKKRRYYDKNTRS